MPKQMSKRKQTLAKQAAKWSVRFIDQWDTYASKRLKQIKEYELAYYGQVRPTLLGRSNIPFPVLAKYVDELKSRLDDFPTIKIENHQRLAQMRVTQKVQGAIDIFKKPTRGDWARNDRMGRINAIFAGYCPVDFFTEREEDGSFYANATPVDHNDFVFEPMQGSDLEKHQAVGKFPYFRTKGQLKALVDAGVYDADQVDKIISKTADSTLKKNEAYFTKRYDRYKALGLDAGEMDGMKGGDIFAFAQLQMTHPENNKRYLVTLDYKTGEWVRFERLKEVHGTEKYSIKLWQTHEDPNVVMCKAPCDDIYPVAEGLRIKINQLFDYSTKKLWGQRAVDPNFFPDMDDLEWKRPDQIVIARAYNGKPISQGIYEFKAEGDDSGSLPFIQFMESFLASVVGVNPNDVSEDVKKVGVFFGQLQKSAARLGVYNKSYSEMWEKGVQQLIYGMKANMTQSMMVALIGTAGVEWDELTGEELDNPDDFEVVAESSTVETELNEARKKRRQESLTIVLKDEGLKAEFSPRWLAEQVMRSGDYDDAEIRRGMDTKTYGSEEELSRADQAIEQILKGEKPAVYIGASAPFLEYIYRYAMRMDDDDMKLRTQIMEYGLAHIEIVTRNVANEVVVMQALKGTPVDQLGPDGKPLPPKTAAPVQQIPKGPRRPSPAAQATPATPAVPATAGGGGDTVMA